jgi:phosphoserine phosphatase
VTVPGDRSAGRIALLDWDNSLHAGFTMSPWLHALARDEREVDVARRFDAALAAYEAGTMAYDAFAGLAETLYTGLADGRSVAEVRAIADRFVRDDPLRPGTPQLVDALLAAGIRPVLISGAPIEVLSAHAAALGFAPRDVTGWQLEQRGDVYVGRLASGNTAQGGAKAALVDRLVAAGDQVVLGVGDSPADRPLVDAARIGAWIDPAAATESGRVRWSDRETGTERVGSLTDLAEVIRRLR